MDGWTQIDPRLRGELDDLAAESDNEEQEIQSEQEDADAVEEESGLGYNPQILSSNYDRQLDHDRQAKKRKLQSRFEHIFDKYGRDFEGIGDEIDLETGLIIVDNGHLKRMQHENDPGYPAGDGTQSQPPKGLEPDSADAIDLRLAEDVVSDGNSDADLDEGDNDNGNASEEPGDIFEHLQSVKATMIDLQSKQRQGQTVDSNDIEALGMSIAKQLADFVSRDKPSSRSKKRRAKNALWSCPDLPKVHRQPTQQPRSRCSTPLPFLTEVSPGHKSLWAPIQHPRKRKSPKRRKLNSHVEDDTQADEEFTAMSVDGNDADELPELSNDSAPRACANCRCTNSLIWRSGPDGDLCNACGMYYYRYGLIRPLAPPSESGASDSEDSDADDNTDPRLRSGSAADGASFNDVVGENASNGLNEQSRRRLKGKRFTKEDDAMVIKLKEIDRLSWETIAKHFPGRTAYGVQCRYSKTLCNRPVEARAHLANQGYESRHDENGVIVFAPAVKHTNTWTEEEDDLLLKLREEDKLEWSDIANSFTGRNARAMERRFAHLERRYTNPKASYRSKVKKRKDLVKRIFAKYTSEEDELVLRLRDVEKMSWADIADRLPGRNAMALQKRYVRELVHRSQDLGQDPLVERAEKATKRSRKKNTRFSKEEDDTLLHMRNALGLGWKEIEFQMPGRGWQSIENRFQYISKGLTRDRRRSEGTPAEASTSNIENGSSDVKAVQSDDELVNDTEELPFVALQPYLTAQAEGQLTADNTEHHLQSPQGHGFFSEGEAMFTQEEDTQIRQLRELQKLPWDAIAVQLPGRSVSAISARYYQILFPKSQSNDSTAPRESSATSFLHPMPIKIASRIDLASSAIASKRALRWTKEEDDLIVHYRGQGLSFEEIGERMPWRTHKAIKHFYNSKHGKKRSSTSVVALTLNDKAAMSPGAPQKLDLTTTDLTVANDSDAVRSEMATANRAHFDRKADTKPGFVDDAGAFATKRRANTCSTRSQTKDATASSFPSAHPVPANQPVEAYASLLSQYLADKNDHSIADDEELDVESMANPLTPSRLSHIAQSPTMRTYNRSMRTTNYFTPAPHVQSQPYFLAPLSNKNIPLFTGHGLSNQKAVIDPRLLEENFAEPPPPLDLRAQSTLPAQIERPTGEAMLIDHMDNQAVMQDNISGEVDFFRTQHSPITHGLPLPTHMHDLQDTATSMHPFDEYDGNGPGLDDNNENIVQNVDPAMAPLLDEQADPGKVEQYAVSGSHVEKDDGADHILANETFIDEGVGLEMSGIDEPQSPNVSIAKQDTQAPLPMDEDTDFDTECSAPVSHHSSLHDSGFFEDTTDSTIDTKSVEDETEMNHDSVDEPKTEASPPTDSWKDILVKAFNAKGSKSVNVKDIFKFVENKYLYYRANGSAWKDEVQACLQNDAEFVQVSRTRPLWVFKKALDHKSAVGQPQAEKSDAKHESEPEPEPEIERLITTKSLRERPARKEQPAKATRVPGRPRKVAQEVHKVDSEAPLHGEPIQETEAATTIPEDHDELAPSPDGKSGHTQPQIRSRTSSVRPSPFSSVPKLDNSFQKSSTPSLVRKPADPYRSSVTRSSLLTATNSTKHSMSNISKMSDAMLSSSPTFVSTKTPATVYSKAGTPGTAQSTLFSRGRPKHRNITALRSSFGGVGTRSRSSSVALPGSRKRVVYTPVRDVEGSDDELAD